VRFKHEIFYTRAATSLTNTIGQLSFAHI